MKDKGLKAVYLKLDEDLNIKQEEIPFNDIFNSKSLTNQELFFGFESNFDPYQHHIINPLDHIDLVIKNMNGDFLRPLEVKLTVVPDNATCEKPEPDWGPELVIRPDSTIYCVLGIIDACNDYLHEIRAIFEPVCSRIQSWDNTVEMVSAISSIIDITDAFERQYLRFQKPLIMQPIWKTKGKSANLAENAFDIFIWSDFAFTRLFLNYSRITNQQNPKISRQMRSSLRFARCLYEISCSGRVNLDTIYKQMTFTYQNDKEFAVNGNVTNRYLRSDRLLNPLVKKSTVSKLILNGGEKLLSPERRFDQTIYFTMTEH